MAQDKSNKGLRKRIADLKKTETTTYDPAAFAVAREAKRKLRKLMKRKKRK